MVVMLVMVVIGAGAGGGGVVGAAEGGEEQREGKTRNFTNAFRTHIVSTRMTVSPWHRYNSGDRKEDNGTGHDHATTWMLGGPSKWSGLIYGLYGYNRWTH